MPRSSYRCRPTSTFLMRHSNGTYDFQSIYDEPFSCSCRLVASVDRPVKFPGDPAGNTLRGRIRCHGQPGTTPIGSTGEFPNNELPGSSRRSVASRRALLLCCGESHRARVDDGARPLVGTLRQIIAGAAKKTMLVRGDQLCPRGAAGVHGVRVAVDRDRRNKLGGCVASAG